MMGSRDSHPAVLFVGGGLEAVPALLHARALGYRLIVLDARTNAPGMLMADAALLASIYDEKQCLQRCRSYLKAGGRIDGVTSVGTDAPRTLAHLAKGLGLPGVSPQAAALSSDKLAMKDRLIKAGLPVPDYAPLTSVTEIDVWLRRYPAIVVKPVDSRGARGVSRLTRADSESMRRAALERALGNSSSGRAMIEQFIPGVQLSTEGLLIDKKPFPIGLVERNYERMQRFHPFIIEDGGHYPPTVCEAVQEEAELLALKAGAVLGQETGPVKGDIVVGPDGPAVIEVALRLSGGYLATDQIPFAFGVDLIGTVLSLCCGHFDKEKAASFEALRPRRSPRGLAIRYIFAEPGRIDSIEGEARLLGHPDILFCRLHHGPGDVIEEMENHTARMGAVLACGPDREAAINLAHAAIRDLQVTQSN